MKALDSRVSCHHSSIGHVHHCPGRYEVPTILQNWIVPVHVMGGCVVHDMQRANDCSRGHERGKCGVQGLLLHAHELRVDCIQPAIGKVPWRTLISRVGVLDWVKGTHDHILPVCAVARPVDAVVLCRPVPLAYCAFLFGCRHGLHVWTHAQIFAIKASIIACVHAT